MRLIGATLVAISLPVLAAAQSSVSTRPASSTMGSIGLPLPSILSPLTSIGLPLSPLGLPPQTDSRPRDRASRSPRGSHGDRHQGTPPSQTVLYFVPYYAGFLPQMRSAPADVPPPPPPPVAARETGVLRLELESAAPDTQVYADGEFIGSSEDAGAQLMMEAGSHEIEIRAAGYESLVFGVRIAADRTITYRGALKPVHPLAPHAEAPAIPTTFYFIPGCYLGNVPPAQASLPATCDMSRLSTYKQ